MKQKMPKLCNGLIVCQIGLLLSVDVHTLIYVKMKIRSKTNSTISVPMIWVIIVLPISNWDHLFFAAIRSNRRKWQRNCNQT